jgi:hypothetical protein
MLDQNRLAGFAVIVGTMLLAASVNIAFFISRGEVPPFLLVILPSALGAGLLAAGVLHKRDTGWMEHRLGSAAGR